MMSVATRRWASRILRELVAMSFAQEGCWRGAGRWCRLAAGCTRSDSGMPPAHKLGAAGTRPRRGKCRKRYSGGA